MPQNAYQGPIEKVDEHRWRIPKSYNECMRVDGIIYADDRLIADIKSDQSPQQVANVACLPGIVGASLAMPDIHWGYGFPIGGVAATDPDEGGVVSPGGVGYDINCGVRLVRSDLEEADVADKVKPLVDQIFRDVPCGVGVGAPETFDDTQMERILTEGARAVVDMGRGTDDDVRHTEDTGRLDGADPGRVSPRAMDRGREQVGTLGAGNHFLEIQVVDEIFEPDVAEAFGVETGQVTFMIHTGSRGFGHQVCDDFLKTMRKAARRYGISLPDQQLCCAPVDSDEGRAYMGAMRCAANFAFANRQLILDRLRGAVAKALVADRDEPGLRQVYDVAHNIAKLETHTVNGRQRSLCVHRKGATRAFPAGHPEVPEAYRDVGQPVIIPGDMGRTSFLLVGNDAAMEKTFGSVCHGAGRQMSRSQARKQRRGEDVRDALAERGIVARSKSWKGLAEEHSGAYKDVADVVRVVTDAGLARKVCRLRPLGVIKG